MHIRRLCPATCGVCSNSQIDLALTNAGSGAGEKRCEALNADAQETCDKIAAARLCTDSAYSPAMHVRCSRTCCELELQSQQDPSQGMSAAEAARGAKAEDYFYAWLSATLFLLLVAIGLAVALYRHRTVANYDLAVATQRFDAPSPQSPIAETNLDAG